MRLPWWGEGEDAETDFLKFAHPICQISEVLRAKNMEDNDHFTVRKTYKDSDIKHTGQKTNSIKYYQMHIEKF